MRVHSSVVIALVLAEPLLISQLDNASAPSGAQRVEATKLARSIHADAELLRNQVANGASQRRTDQNECGAARGCDA